MSIKARASGGESMRRSGPVVLVYSPHAGHATDDDAVQALEDAGVTVSQRLRIDELDHGAPRLDQWTAAGVQAVVAAGGDGTIGCVASRLAGSDLPLGILPMGTANDVARSLGIPLDVPDACTTIATGTTAQMDAGEVVPLSRDGQDGRDGADAERQQLPTELFLQALALGWKVWFARLATDVSRRKRWGHLTYLVSALESLKHCRSLPVTLRLDGRALGGVGPAEMRLRVFQLTVANTAVFGGALNLRIPDVHAGDRLLDIVVVEAPTWRHLRMVGADLLSAGDRLAEYVVRWMTGNRSYRAPRPVHQAGGWLASLPNVQHIQAHAVTIETAEPEDVTLDGDIRAQTPIRVRVAARPIRILVAAERPNVAPDHTARTDAPPASDQQATTPTTTPSRGRG